MSAVIIDPDSLPRLDIVHLAQHGLILRAERTTTADALPAFIPARDWETLMARFGAGYGDKTPVVLAGLEKSVAALMGHVASSVQARGGPVRTTFACRSDLFGDNDEVLVVLVRDTTHRAACALIGTRAHIRDVVQDAVGLSDEIVLDTP